jgi:hypothetical protein
MAFAPKPFAEPVANPRKQIAAVTPLALVAPTPAPCVETIEGGG